MRSSLVTSELLLVRALGFDLEIELPFAYCLNILRGLGSIKYFSLDDSKKPSKRHIPSQKEIWKRTENGNRIILDIIYTSTHPHPLIKDMEPEMSAIARLAWTYVWDSICSPKIALSHSIPGIGLGCLYLAMRTFDVEMAMSMNEYVDMWGASENISVQAVRDVVTDLLDFYERSMLLYSPSKLED
ncbi:hypothetical protein BDB01DRAFT_718587 [Pilobolus umbonatus]|nr:hypothetical protein BDB01DRAFT_718587 [Pilobolus umbonatus]